MIIDRYELSRKLKQLKGLTLPKTTMAVAGVLIKDGRIMATNGEMTVSANLAIETDAPFVLPSNAVEMIEKLTCDNVDITVKNNKVKIKHKNGTSNFATASVNEFPDVTDGIELNDCNNLISCGASHFAEYVSLVTHIGENVEGRVIANSVCFTGMSSGAVEFATCDGRAIAYVSGLKAPKEFKAVIQTPTVKKVVSLINANKDDTFGFYLPDKRHALFVCGEYTVYANLIGASFIEYRAAFPKKSEASFELKKDDLVKCLERAVICSDALNPTILTAKDKYFNVSVRSATSDFNEAITLEEPISNCEVKFGINAKLLLTLIKASTENTLRFSYVSSTSPIVIFDGLVHQLIMPVRLKEGE